MVDQSYTSALLAGLGQFIASLDAGAFATYLPPEASGKYPASAPRPIYTNAIPSSAADEVILLSAGQPFYGANNNVETPVSVLLRGPRNGTQTTARDWAEHLTDAFRDAAGRPLVHVQFGRVRLGRAQASAPQRINVDEAKRPQFSTTITCRGRRFLT